MSTKKSTESFIRGVKRKTRRRFSDEEKIRIVVEGLLGEESIAEFSRREGVAQSLYYKWSKDFMEADRRRLAGDTKREANSDEVALIRKENEDLKALVAELSLENRVLKKSLSGEGQNR